MFGQETVAAVRRAADETAATAAEVREQLDTAVWILAVTSASLLAVVAVLLLRQGRPGLI